MPKQHQTEEHIKVFKGLDGVRKKPGMYIGPTDSHGIFTILREAMDNSVDEYLANNKNDSMTVQVFANGYLAVHDNGQGIPVGRHKTENVSALEVAVGMLHAGGKLEDSAYKQSRGTHGVGVAVTNALSSHFQVFTNREGKWWTVEFKKGKRQSPTARTSAKAMRETIEPVYDQGTIVLFKPDLPLFRAGSKLEPKMVRNWAKTTAYLSGGFSVTVADDNEEKTYLYKRGILDWLDASIKKLGCGTLMEKPISVRTEHMDLCMSLTDAEGNLMRGYCNGLQQVDGGVHVNTTMSALYASLKAHAGAKDTFSREDVSEGLLGIVNFKIASPAFASQTKEKLVDQRFADLCKADLEAGLAAYWKANATLAKEVCRRASLLRTAKVDFSSQKKALQSLRKKRTDLFKIPGKLAAVPNCKPEERELFLVEGDSAGGTAERARMVVPYRYQETLCLRGKVPNAYKMDHAKVLANEEVLNILTALGYEPNAKNPLAGLRVGKLVLLSDPDPDGHHIDSLLLALLTTFVPELFDKEIVYKSLSPKYMLTVGKKQYFGMSVDEVMRHAPQRGKHKATYLKGWGEANDSAMRRIAFDPATRHLELAEPPSKKDMRDIALLMGDDTAYRRELLGV